jgi:hypothetical protein
MSIFKDTFKQEVQDQLKVRQEAIFKRTPTAIQYFNARNAWIRMSSSVNVGGSNELAQKYVLQGGTLSNGNQLLSGVGLINQAYSLNTANNQPNRLGIRPMPGITGINVKSKSAYGSLKEVEVKFNAWDIKQLEELELLYMRPGYTVLIEWGWAPYLDNNSTLQASNIDFYNIINPTKLPTKEQIFKDLYDNATKTYGGNYDSLFGYVKNYSWSARDDGGYDCTTTVISVGEVMESLKVNYAPLNNMDKIVDGGGLLIESSENIANSDRNRRLITGGLLFFTGLGGIIYASLTEDKKKILKEEYTKNILAGLFYEIWNLGESKGGIRTPHEKFTFTDRKNNVYDGFRTVINISGGEGDSSSTGKVGASDVQVYITLESLCTLINNNVTFTDSNSQQAYVTCSVFDREYPNESPNSPNSSTGEGGYLLCLAHPLQISMDPSVCAINPSFWLSGQLPSATIAEELNPPVDTNVVVYSNTSSSIFLDLIEIVKKEVEISDFGSESENRLINALSSTLKGDLNEIKQFSKIWYENNPGKNLYDYLDSKLTEGEINKAIGNSTLAEQLKGNPAIVEKQKLEEVKKEIKEKQTEAADEGKNNLAYLKDLNPYFYQNNPSTELGIIGNIYVNVNFLYRLATNNNLESKDTKEKQDINLYDYLKNIMSSISAAIGSVNNFDIHVDPQDNIVRIIDINYVDKEQREKVYDSLFTLEMHNTKSTVRSYKLESQIFPDQSSIVAIGAQVGGGAMATDNNTMLDFNKGLEDRIILKKDDVLTDPNQTTADTIANQLKNLSSVFDVFYDYFSWLKTDPILGSSLNDADFDTEKVSQYQNALRDLINFYKNLTKSNIKNRAIIPTKLSITMDGIGGLVIGHMFKIPEDLLPKGYKGDTLGSKLGYTITGIGHSVSNNDWTTNIDAQTIILDEPSGVDLKFFDLTDKEKVKAVSPVETFNKKANLSPSAKQAPIVSKYGEIGDESQLTTLTFPYPMYYGEKLVKTTKVHVLAKDSLENIFKEILSVYGIEKIKKLKLDQFSGLYNVRPMREGSTPSVHSWGIAIDIYAAENGLNTPTGQALFSKPEYQQFINIWYKYGWKSFGKELGRDWMHFQVADAPF